MNTTNASQRNSLYTRDSNSISQNMFNNKISFVKDPKEISGEEKFNSMKNITNKLFDKLHATPSNDENNLRNNDINSNKYLLNNKLISQINDSDNDNDNENENDNEKNDMYKNELSEINVSIIPSNHYHSDNTISNKYNNNDIIENTLNMNNIIDYKEKPLINKSADNDQFNNNSINIPSLNLNNPLDPKPLQNLKIQSINDLNNRLTGIFKKTKENEIIENCANLCKKQIDCRYLQKIIDDNPSLASDIFYDKIKDKFLDISCDQFGNYFMQKIVTYLKPDHIHEILYKKVSSQFRSLSFNQHGTRIVQKILEKITNIEQDLNYFILLLSPNIKDFTIDHNASHIIIKFVNLLPGPKSNFIFKYLIENAFDLATKKYSCCVLQKCLEYADPIQKQLLLKAIVINSYGLFNDQYGNYVVQYCINICDYELNKIIARNFLFDIVRLSTQKYSSNVIEKCLDCCDENTKEIITQKFCDPNIISVLLFDMYGNYVLQKVLLVSEEPIKSQLISIMGPLLPNLLFYNFGQQLYTKLIVSFPEFSKYVMTKDELKTKKRKKSKKTGKWNIDNNVLRNMDINNMNNININNNISQLNQISNNSNINLYNQNFNNNNLINFNRPILNIQNANNNNFNNNYNTNFNNIFNNYNQYLSNSTQNNNLQLQNNYMLQNNILNNNIHSTTNLLDFGSSDINFQMKNIYENDFI